MIPWEISQTVLKLDKSLISILYNIHLRCKDLRYTLNLRVVVWICIPSSDYSKLYRLFISKMMLDCYIRHNNMLYSQSQDRFQAMEIYRKSLEIFYIERAQNFIHTNDVTNDMTTYIRLTSFNIRVLITHWVIKLRRILFRHSKTNSVSSF